MPVIELTSDAELACFKSENRSLKNQVDYYIQKVGQQQKIIDSLTKAPKAEDV